MISLRFLFGAGATLLDPTFILIVVWNILAIDQFWVINKELLNTTCQQINVVEAFFRKNFGYSRAMPFIVWEYDYYFILKVLEPTQSLKVIVSVNPSVRIADWANNMELIKFFMAMDSITSHVKHYDILMSKIQKLFQTLIWSA